MASCENGNSRLSPQVISGSLLQDSPRISPQTLTNQPREDPRILQHGNQLQIPGQDFSRFRCSPQDTPRILPQPQETNARIQTERNPQTSDLDNTLQLPGPSGSRCSPRYTSVNVLQVQVPRQDYSRFGCSPRNHRELLCSPPPDYQETVHGQPDLSPRPNTPVYLISTPILSPRPCYDSKPPSYQDIYPAKEEVLPKIIHNRRTILINVTELHNSRNPNWLPSLPPPPPGVEVAPPRNRSYRERMRYLKDLHRYRCLSGLV